MFLSRTLRSTCASRLAAALLTFCSVRGWTTDVIDDAIAVPRAAALTVDEVDALSPGWIQHFEVERLVMDDHRVARLVAIFVPQDSAATPFLPPGAFRVTMSGWLDLELPGRYSFRAEGRGLVTMTINGVTVLDQLKLVPNDNEPAKWTQLSGGMHHVVVGYRSPTNADAQLRLLWRGETFVDEPLPPKRLFHDSRHSALKAQTELRHGLELIDELHCMRCHPSERITGEDRVAGWGRAAPGLRAAGARFERAWLFDWILEPQAMRDDARMPQVLAGASKAARRRAAADIVDFLSSDATPIDSVARPDSEAAAVERGRRLFESLGCISCHRLAGAPADDAYRRISLALVSQKYRAGQVALFLQDPQRDDAWRAMPNFALSEQEAQDLESFLRATAEPIRPIPSELAGADATRGAALFTKFRCVACHGTTTGVERNAPAMAGFGAVLQSQDYTSGCLADRSSSPRDAPRFRISPSDLESLRRLVAMGRIVRPCDDSAEAAERMIGRLRCNHCHQRDDLASLWPEVMAEEGSQGSLPESVPSLTWTGEKLQVEWTRRVLSGDRAARARPWLHARMPSFPAYAETIAIGLARQHGFSADARLGPPAPPGHAEVGKRLTEREEGFFCIECHAVRRQAALGAFSHQGVNFDQVGQRLNHDYFQRWITNPTRVDAGTKMPTFSADGRRTARTQILEGRAQAQFEAIWHYLRLLSHEDTDGPNIEASRTRTHGRSDSAADRGPE
jgi:mono/diheme cytochrome c family protein